MTIRSVYTSIGLGLSGSEASVVMHGRQSPGGVPVIFCHGLLVGAVQSFNVEGDAQRFLADPYEVTSAGADLGGLSTWGNDASIDAVTELVAALNTTYGTNANRVALYGTSMGGCTALNWAMRNPSKVAGIALSLPVVDLEGIHDRDPVGVADLIETAYTDEAGYLAALPTHDPSHPNNIPTLRQLGGRTRIWYSTDDTVVVASEVLHFAGQVGATLTSMGAVGHSGAPGMNSAVAKYLDVLV